MIDLFNRESLVSDSSSGIWNDGDPFTLLASAAIIRIILFWFIATTPAPSGVFAPAVVLGGIIGRAFAGTYFLPEFGNDHLGIPMNRRLLAVAGAGAFAGVISKTTSPILILLEMTGDMEYLIGLLITLLVANSIAGVYTMSFFDTVLNIRKLPYLPVLYSSMWYKRVAAEVMEPQTFFIYKNSNLIDLLAVISRDSKIDKEHYVAVLESAENPVLIGSFKISNAFAYLEAEVQEIENKLRTGIASSDYRFQKFFQSLKNEAGIEISNAGDSCVIEMSDQLRTFLKDLVCYETKFHYDKDGKIIEEKVLAGKDSAKGSQSPLASGKQ